jgi:hypothetical protein
LTNISILSTQQKFYLPLLMPRKNKLECSSLFGQVRLGAYP